MNPINLQTLATGFGVLSIAMGVPSFVVLVLYVINEIRNRINPTPNGTNFGDHPDALLLMLKVMSESIGAIGRLAGWFGRFLFQGLALVSIVGLLLALALWFTSRGLQVRASWARVSAFVLLLLALLPSLLLALSRRNLVRVAMLLLAAVCLLGLRGVWLNQILQTH